MLGSLIGMVIGMATWNYFGPTIKSWLHMGESKIGRA